MKQVDLWGHVQADLSPESNVRMIPVSTQTLHVCVHEGWYANRHSSRADELLIALDAAMLAGRHRKAERLRARWLEQVHLDRLNQARTTARERGLRLDPIGRGPVVDRETVHYRDRLPWYLTPVNRYSDDRLPDRAAAVLDRWNGTGSVFDTFFIADQPVSSGHFPIRSLVGAISRNGRTGDWFVLDRWAE